MSEVWRFNDVGESQTASSRPVLMHPCPNCGGSGLVFEMESPPPTPPGGINGGRSCLRIETPPPTPTGINGRGGFGLGGGGNGSDFPTNPPRPSRECKFCRNNGEAVSTYSSHTLRCPLTHRLICPVLRSHVCELCGATGDDAHTKNYCPRLSREEKMNRALPSQLHRTRRQANGIRETEGF